MTQEELTQKSRDFAITRYGNNGGPTTTQNEMAKVQACAVGYRVGWNEALNQLWHEATETPQDGKTLLTINEAGTPFICGPNNTEWEEAVKTFGIVRWCYVEDLL